MTGYVVSRRLRGTRLQDEGLFGEIEEDCRKTPEGVRKNQCVN